MLKIRFEFAFEFLIIFVKGQKKQTKYVVRMREGDNLL